MFVFSFTVYVLCSGKKRKCDQVKEETKPAEGTQVSPAVRSGPTSLYTCLIKLDIKQWKTLINVKQGLTFVALSIISTSNNTNVLKLISEITISQTTCQLVNKSVF